MDLSKCKGSLKEAFVLVMLAETLQKGAHEKDKEWFEGIKDRAWAVWNKAKKDHPEEDADDVMVEFEWKDSQLLEGIFALMEED